MVKRKTVYFNIPHTGRTVKLHIAIFSKEDEHVVIDSGVPYREPQYLFLDYDDFYPKEEAEYIVKKYSIRRALITESTPKKYQLLSFSPMWFGYIAEIMMNSRADKNHCARLFLQGNIGIRVTPKRGYENYPKIIDSIVNRKGKNFYNFDAEKAYRSLLEADWR